MKSSKKFRAWVDKQHRQFDTEDIGITNNLSDIPARAARAGGGKVSYAEWAYVTGIFQTLIDQNLSQKSGAHVLDVGCGNGILGLAARPYIEDGGRYVGLEIQKEKIDFCRSHFQDPEFQFVLFEASNPKYNQEAEERPAPWPFEDSSFNIATALSVWTHLNERDGKFYLKELHRVLKPGGKAIITFFYLDELYEKYLQIKKPGKGRFHGRKADIWVFDSSAYGSQNWKHPSWVNTPEGAIGITRDGMTELLEECGFSLHQYYSGNWKESPGIYFQDVLILEKAAG